MATYSRVGINGWRQGDDATDQARVGLGGWYQVKAEETPPTAPTLSDLRAINVGPTSVQWSIDYTFA